MPNLPFDLKENGSLRIYNQFPRSYPGGLVEMTEKLAEIAGMNFNAVWINPVQLVGERIVERRELIINT